jgi:adenine-specific DNA methylase
MTDRRFIEDTFPVKEVSAESAREKSIRHGHISTLHAWWARRPLASSRATAYASLVSASDDPVEREKRRQFIAELCKWENSLDPHQLERARRDILEAHAKRLSEERGELVTVKDIKAGLAPSPRVLDPFAGGGAIPLEALRLGCEVHASDYNPVAVLILRATLEYPQTYGHVFEGMPKHLLGVDEQKRGKSKDQETGQMALDVGESNINTDFNPLVEAVTHWGNWVLEEARKELHPFYPTDPDDSIPVGYLWARTIPCQNPACGAEIPLMRQFWLARRKDRHIALCPKIREGRVEFVIVAKGSKVREGQLHKHHYGDWPEGYKPSEGTISRAVVTCPVCGSSIDAKTTRQLFRNGKTGQRMVAVILANEGQSGKHYRLPVPNDLSVFGEAESALAKKREELKSEWGLDPVPDEMIPITELRRITVPIYGMEKWADLFNPRQQLAMITFAEKVRQAHADMVQGAVNGTDDPTVLPYPEEFANVVATFLALFLHRLVAYCSSLGPWHVTGEKMTAAMQRQAIAMVFDYGESIPISESFSWSSNQDWVVRVIEHLAKSVKSIGTSSQVWHSTATRLNHEDGSFDAILTDPPYYDSVPYSHLADFYYVWLKRTIGHIYPDLFVTPLTPKGEEIVQDRPHSRSTSTKTKDFFERELTNAFREIYRVLRNSGLACIVYAHKTFEGWETVINALLDSGLVVSSAWPIDTEMRARLNARDTASLASSMYIVARKMKREPAGFYKEVREKLRGHLNSKLDSLWAEGIGGADFFIAAIGSAIEVFGRHEHVIDYEGNVVRANRLLDDVRTMATDFAVRRILRDGFVEEVSDLTRFYVLWRWNFGEARAPFDEARKLAQSCGLDLTREWNRTESFVRKQKEYVRVVDPGGRDLKHLAESHELIDGLHLALRLWEKGQRGEMVQALAASGFGGREVFYRVAQAVAESLPKESKEKRLLEGFLAGRERVRAEVGKVLQQGKLFD